MGKVRDEQSPAHDSQGKGGVEVGVVRIRGLFRTLRLGLEASIGKKVPVDHAIMPWLLEHTALLFSFRSRLPSGLTPWATIRGRPFGQRLMGFGEVVLWKLPTKGPASQPEGNRGARWSDGVSVGYSRSSYTFIVMPEDGKKAVISISRYPEQTRWSAEAISKIKATPWSELEIADPEVRFQEPVVDRQGVEVAAQGALKRFRINAADLQAHGCTDGCPQCGHIRRYGRGRAGGIHSDHFRERLLKAIGDTALGRQRLDDYDERVNRAMAEQIERAEKPAAAEQPAAAATRAAIAAN